MMIQSTMHVLMIEPKGFISNPQTMETNPYQEKGESADITAAAIAQFRAFRDRLVENGVCVTTVEGSADTPDAVFPNNWVSTHEKGVMMTYPMLVENRRAERRLDIISVLNKMYPTHLNWTESEKQGLILEGTGSLVLDRVNRKAYAIVSPRTNRDLVEKWCQTMQYTPVIFEAFNDKGQSEYHTNVDLFIGTKLAGICVEKIPESQRDFVLGHLRQTHQVIELSATQIANYCGNVLELQTPKGPVSVMSEQAWSHLTADQQKIFLYLYPHIITSDLSVIEKYGGGSARCMLLELF